MTRNTPAPTRLEAVASLVPPGSRVADVGTGHGKLPRRLLASGRASHCIASERSRALRDRIGPRLRGPAAQRLDLRVGDGLAVLGADDRVDVLVLSGMGARRILRILETPRLRLLGIRRLILQPQCEIPLVRRWLARNGLPIVDERLVRERGRFYVVLAAEWSAPTRPSAYGGLGAEELLEAGPCLVRSPDPVVRLYWSERLDRMERILRRAPSGPGSAAAARGRALALRVLGSLPGDV